MRAVVCTELGDPTQPLGPPGGPLSLEKSHPTPPIKDGCIRIQVSASSINFPDALQVMVSSAWTPHAGMN